MLSSGIDTDLKMFEAFAENMSTLFVNSDQESVKNEMKARGQAAGESAYEQ
jgi:exocyst complex component 6